MKEKKYYHLLTCIDHPGETFRLNDTLIGIFDPRCSICNKHMADTGETVERGIALFPEFDELDFNTDSYIVKKAKAYAAKRKRELEES